MHVPEDLIYTEEHEWIRRGEGTTFRLGITDYAQDQLGDIVFIELPEVGANVESGGLLAEVESTKSVGEVYAPVAGTIAAVNASVSEHPELVNSDPYGEGWLVEIDATDALAEHLDAEAYRALIE